MIDRSDCRFIIFAKAPVPGEVKTRLIPVLGEGDTTLLYERMVLHTLTTAVNAALGPVDLWCTPSMEHPFFRRCNEEYKVKLMNQTDGDIGRRMAYALCETLKRASRALLLGTDCPSLTADDLREAAALLKEETDAVIIPSEDGGYVLIGLRRNADDLFRGISWGTERVMEETRLRLRNLGWQWHELPERWDVDRSEDVERLKVEGYLSLVSTL
ncbi:MAG: TIGR04282 family arsenosugar biosynthesis glycosyltransferase [Thermodesulfobacteriota bacterium]|jgi:rSAM/selenodomain-associated transferase 1